VWKLYEETNSTAELGMSLTQRIVCSASVSETKAMISTRTNRLSLIQTQHFLKGNSSAFKRYLAELPLRYMPDGRRFDS
jgi:hypothetical protein